MTDNFLSKYFFQQHGNELGDYGIRTVDFGKLCAGTTGKILVTYLIRRGVGGGGGKKRGLGPVNLRGGQRIIECIFHKVKYFRGEKRTSRGNNSIIGKMT